MSEPHYWWYAYGHFRPGKHNLPHLGEVIAYYFALSELSKEVVASRLKVTERYVDMLKSPKNASQPTLLARRILLAKLLHIPPILLGLSSVTLLEFGEGNVAEDTEHTTRTVATTQTMTGYERLLALSWELYYTSSVQKAEASVDDALQQLYAGFHNASGTKKDQYDAMLCRFYQLYSLIMRDRLELEQGIAYENKAVEIAFRLRNAELIASSLLRRARILLRQADYQAALQDALTALPYADLTRDPLKGKCYQMAGEAQGYLASTNRDLQEKSLAYFSKAAQIARKGNLEPDGSFVKTDLTSILIEKADALVLFGRFQEAHSALAIARKNLSPELTRWEINLLLSEARAYAAQEDVESCCYSLIDALNIVRAVKLSSKEDRIVSVYEKCKQIDPGNTSVQSLEKLLLAK
jgi:tetratricopeptide (TPR) repeat protein